MDDTPVAVLLTKVVVFLRRFVVLTDSQAIELALWVAHTHAFQAANTTPYQSIQSAEKESGKTRSLEVLELLVAKPWMTGGTSTAALIRRIDLQRPSLLLDESDPKFKGSPEFAEALREILNVGHRRGGMITRCVGEGANMTTKQFDVFCPKAIAGLGKLPDTVAGRAVPLRLKRKAPGEHIERFRRRLVEAEAKEPQIGLSDWAKHNVKSLADAWPSLPEELSDRQQDGAEPLLAIADMAGGDWPERARKAFLELFVGRRVSQDDSVGVALLADIREIFVEKAVERLHSIDLVGALCANETSPWTEFNRGKPLTQAGLARLLSPFEIYPRDIRIDGKALKGYEEGFFGDAWSRYLPRDPRQARQTSNDAGSSEFQKAQPHPFVATEKSEESPTKTRVVADVAAPISPLWDELGSPRFNAKEPPRAVRCLIHPANTDFWQRGHDVLCGKCHPNPKASEEDLPALGRRS